MTNSHRGRTDPLGRKARLDSTFVTGATGASSPSSFSGPALEFLRVCTDSRSVRPGDLFVALKGDAFDAHDFIASAVQAGATGVLCRKGTPHSGATLYFEVNDTLAAFRSLAAAWRREFQIPVVAVAGSVGKTTTKEFLASILSGRFARILKTEASQNGFIGIPMTLMGLRPEHQAAVIEVGIDEIGAMAQHLEVVCPTHSLVTAIAEEHLEKLRDLATVAHEENLALTETARRGGTALVHLDDSWIAPVWERLPPGRRMGYGFQKSVTGTDVLQAQARDQVLVLQGESYSCPLPGSHHLGNLLGAVAAALALGLSPDEIRTGLARFQGAYGRTEMRELPGPIQVICDFYNANPASTRAALGLLPQSGRTHVCLGDMLELGPDEEAFHRALTDPLLAASVGHVYLFGLRMTALKDELSRRGFSGYCEHFPSHASLASALQKRMKPGDTILLKGSRGMRMEEVWNLIST